MEPLNIQRLVRQNKQYAEASQHAQSITRGSIVSGWHEKHDSRGCTPGVGDCLSYRAAATSGGPLGTICRSGASVTTSSSWTSSSSSSTGRVSSQMEGAVKHEVEHAKQALLGG
jgi:hypothetical protein